MNTKEMFLEFFNKFEVVCPKREELEQCRVALRQAYKGSHPDYRHSHRFKQFLENKLKMLSVRPFTAFREVVDKLKKHRIPSFAKSNESDTSQHNAGNTSRSNIPPSSCSSSNMTSNATNPENFKKMIRINKLNKTLKELSRMIKKLDKTEVGSSDDENSAYIKCSRYKQRFNEVFEKMCHIKGDSTDAGRLALKKIQFTGTKYPAINSAISRFCNANEDFPDFQDILHTVETFNEKAKMNFTSMKVHQIAASAFKNLIVELRKHRRCDYNDLISYYANDADVDPAEVDMELMNKLKENEKRAKKQEEEIFAEFAARQDIKEKAAGNKKSPDQDDSSNDEDGEVDDEEENDKNSNVANVVSNCDNISLSSTSSSTIEIIDIDENNEDVVNKRKSTNDSSLKDNNSGTFVNKLRKTKRIEKCSSTSVRSEDDRADVDNANGKSTDYSLGIKNRVVPNKLRKIENIPENNNNSSLDKRDEIRSNRSVSFENDCALPLDDPDVMIITSDEDVSDVEKNVRKTRSDVTGKTSEMVTGDFDEKVTQLPIKKHDKRNDNNRFRLKNDDERDLRSNNDRRNKNILRGIDMDDFEKLKKKHNLKNFNVTIPYFKNAFVNGKPTVRNDLDETSKNDRVENSNKAIGRTDDVEDSSRQLTSTTGPKVTPVNDDSEKKSNKTIRRDAEIIEVSSDDDDDDTSSPVTTTKPKTIVINVFSKESSKAKSNPALPKNNVPVSEAQFNRASAATENPQDNRYQKNLFPPKTSIPSSSSTFKRPNSTKNDTNQNYKRGSFSRNDSNRSSSHLPPTSAQFTERTTTTTRCEVTNKHDNLIIHNKNVVSTHVVERIMQHVPTSRTGPDHATANVPHTANQPSPGTKPNSNDRSVDPDCIIID